MSDQNKTPKLLTAANIVTTVRIILVPLFVFLLLAPWPSWLADPVFAQLAKPWVAAIVFIILASTDGLDGYLARSRNEVTNFGKFLDPLADKILVTAAFLALIELGQLPAWVALIIIARDFLVSGLRMVASAENHVIAASKIGKVKTVFQIIAVVAFIIKDSSVIVFISNIKVLEPVMSVLNLQVVWAVLCWIVMSIALLLTILSMIDYFMKSAHVLGLTVSASKDAVAKDLSGDKVALAGGVPAADALAADAPMAGVLVAGTPVVDAVAKVASVAIGTDVVQKAADLNAKILDISARVVATGIAKKLSIGSAESCTGGMIATAISSIAGASETFVGSVVSYDNQVKITALGVDKLALEQDGAVSEIVAIQMAKGLCVNLELDCSVATTGIAGPSGASVNKPVGMVWIAVASGAAHVQAQCHKFDGSRELVRLQATYTALKMLLNAMS